MEDDADEILLPNHPFGPSFSHLLVNLIGIEHQNITAQTEHHSSSFTHEIILSFKMYCSVLRTRLYFFFFFSNGRTLSPKTILVAEVFSLFSWCQYSIQTLHDHELCLHSTYNLNKCPFKRVVCIKSFSNNIHTFCIFSDQLYKLLNYSVEESYKYTKAGKYITNYK